MPILLLLAPLLFAAPVRKIVVFDASVPAAERERLAATTGATVVHRLDLINAVAVEIEETSFQPAAFQGLANVRRVDDSPRIKWIREAWHAPLLDFKPRPFQKAADVVIAELPWGIERVRAPHVWRTTKGRGIKVAVIETGIDRDHPDLKPNVKGGWNAVDKAKPNDFKDDNGHGTHCAGTIAAKEGGGVVGVAPRASLYGVKVLDAGGSGTYDDVIAGMQWAVKNRMDIASMSLGGSAGNDSLKAAVEAMVKAGVVLIAAAGNSGGSVSYPAAYPDAIAVAASDRDDKTASFSSRGPQVFVIAPGVDVKSAAPNGGYDTMSGTSMATPHVAGLAALTMAGRAVEGQTAMKAALKKASTPLRGVPVEQQGHGLPDARKLIR